MSVVEIEVDCNECGASLEAYGGYDTYGNPKISVVPCEVCQNLAIEAAVDDASN